MGHNNYNKFFKNKEENIELTQNEEPAHNHVVAISKAEVCNCDKLRVRKEPNLESEVLCLIDKGTVFEVQTEVLHNNFYYSKVVVADGVEVVGYCMKDFVKLV